MNGRMSGVAPTRMPSTAAEICDLASSKFAEDLISSAIVSEQSKTRATCRSVSHRPHARARASLRYIGANIGPMLLRRVDRKQNALVMINDRFEKVPRAQDGSFLSEAFHSVFTHALLPKGPLLSAYAPILASVRLLNEGYVAL